MRSFVASRIGETQLYLQSFLERSAAGKQAAGGGNTQVDLPGSTRERLFAKHPDPRSKSGLLERRDVRFGSLADMHKICGRFLRSLLTCKTPVVVPGLSGAQKKARHKAGLEGVFKACVKSLAT
jgi:hypothetical protein